MSEQKAFSLNVDEQNIAWLAIDVPNEKMNTLQAAFADEMKEIFAQLKDASGIKGMIIHSLKPDNFVAGADVRMLEACTTASEAEALAAATNKELTNEVRSALDDLLGMGDEY